MWFPVPATHKNNPEARGVAEALPGALSPRFRTGIENQARPGARRHGVSFFILMIARL